MYTHLTRTQTALVALVLLFLIGSPAGAQTIAGVVTDPSGGVVPGVTVEARNTAQGQPPRTVVSDEGGRYRIVNLQPGTYTVTFTLDGFTPAARPGINLTSDFTATIDMQLRVGTQTDTITVTAESPLVDVQSSAAPQTVTREVLDVLPTSRSAESVGVLIPGVTLRASGGGTIQRDVGGTASMNQSPLQYRGTNDSVQVLTGLRRVYLRPGPEFNGVVYPNDAAVQEISFGQGAEALDMGQSGMRINIVPKSGGNVAHGVLFGSYSRDSFQSQVNIDDRLRSLGFTQQVGLQKMWDVNPSVNGPIVRDRLWYSAAYRSWGVTNTAPITYNEATDHQRYQPGTRPAADPGDIWDVTARIGWQASKADNISFLTQQQTKERPQFGISSVNSPEANSINGFPTHTYQVRWTRVQGANLLFDVAYQYFDMQNQQRPQDPAIDAVWCYENIGTPKTALAPFHNLNEQTLGISYNGNTACTNDDTNNHHSLATATYIRGAHEMKAGVSFLKGRSYNPNSPIGYASYTYRNGVPLQATLRLPTARVDRVNADVGLYAQDRWRFTKLTVNYGVRLDLLRTGWPEQSLPPNPFVASTTFAGRDTFVNWKDISPRIGFAYDVFGNGRTALKGNLSRYVAAETLNLTGLGNPMGALSTTVNRAWSDLNGDRTIFNPDFSLQQAELGPLQNVNFGTVVQNTRVDEGLLSGWGKRPYTYEFDFGVQHQLAARASATAVIYRRWSGKQIALMNEAVTNADYSGPFCVTAPLDARLPNGGGYDVCGLYDINPSALGRTSNVIVAADTLGDGVGKQYNTGVNLAANVRMAGLLVQGGLDLRRDEVDVCGIDRGVHPAGISFPIGGGASIAAGQASPENAIFQDGSTTCDTDSGFRPDIKFSGSYQLGWGIQTSATYQNASGPAITATWPAPNAAVAPALGRNLSAGATQTKTISLIQPDTVFGDRLNQFDVRLSKRFSLGATARLMLNADVYNLFNNNWIIGYTAAYGPNFMRPTQVLSPRLFKLGGQFDF